MKRYKFCDLDGTIILSKRHVFKSKVLVELYNNEPLSYMEKEAYEALQSIPKEEFIPLTSRTKNQFGRIQFFRDNSVPTYALLDNGGTLLINGKEDFEWTSETKSFLSSELERFPELIKELEKMGTVKIQDEMILFLKPNEFAQVSDVEKIIGNYPEMQIFQHGNKIYVCPQKLSKGKAIERFKNKFGSLETIGAGDSIVDLSMLDYVDTYFCIDDLAEKITSKYRDKIRFCSKTEMALRVLQY